MKKVQFEDLGNIKYKDAWDYQEGIFNRYLKIKAENRNLSSEESQEIEGKVLFCEHPHVYTLGKSGEQNNLLINEQFLNKIDASYFKTNRGGDITYHGPGQIVGYPIIDLERFNLQVKQYIGNLEEAIILALREYGISSERLSGATGVWIDINTNKARKICAIGVKASRFITMHGFALNVNTNLEYFNHINPCGFIDKGVTSMQKELNQEVDFAEVKNVVKTKISEVFGMDLKE
ncbi:MAG: lipoyl(octanoyl) transferase LipB [Bacteroidales bacterium]|nr:lipoyl(octanoyl) transferase LipB [Bacteroidales bacterium]